MHCLPEQLLQGWHMQALPAREVNPSKLNASSSQSLAARCIPYLTLLWLDVCQRSEPLQAGLAWQSVTHLRNSSRVGTCTPSRPEIWICLSCAAVSFCMPAVSPYKPRPAACNFCSNLPWSTSTPLRTACLMVEPTAPGVLSDKWTGL